MNQHGGYRGDRRDMLDFSININPLGMPPRLPYDLEAAIADLGRYPEPDAAAHKKRLAARLGVAPEQLILGNGGIDLIYLYTRSVGRGRPSAAVVVPTFNEYRRALAMNGWDPITLWETGADSDFRIDSDAFTAMVARTRPDAVFICNPNNPTGMAYSPAFLCGLMDRCDPAIHWFIDESFIDFSAKDSCRDLLAGERRLVLLRSLTKFFGIPGLRLGYALAHPAIIRAMADNQMPWSVNALALAALDTVFDDARFIADSKSYMAKERHRVYMGLERLDGLAVYPSSADFHLCRLESGTAAALNARLNERGINIRTCEDFTGLGEAYFRIAVKKKADNDRLLAALKEELDRWD